MTQLALPKTVDEITPEWLTAAMQSTNSATGTVTAVDAVPIGVGVGVVGALFRITPTWDGDGPKTVIAKMPSSPSARFVAEMLSMYRRESRFYEQLSVRTPVPHATCYYSQLDWETQDFILLLSDLAGGRIVDQIVGCTLEEAEVAVDRLAELHAAFWNDAALRPSDWLPIINDSPLPEAAAFAYEQGWPVMDGLFGDTLSPAIRAFGSTFHTVLPGLMERLSHPPFTMSHGDYRLDNIFFNDTPDGLDLTLCDWQLVDTSRGGRDLGYFVSQSMTKEMRGQHERDLTRRYVEGLASRGVNDYSFDDAWLDYRVSTLFCLVYPIVAGGSIESQDERSVRLTGDMLDRCVTAIEELNCLDLVD